ncbi:hypothetical protein L1049_021404 [Liquidambar formosana]|uniref:Uncharacterized protein n=1 Tax=Liquidambar formosana TaxID=63359 RepID=A0AAP0N968_LIQFO
MVLIFEIYVPRHCVAPAKPRHCKVGNALTDDLHDHLGVFQFMWSAGMISDQTYKLLNLLCGFQSFIHSSGPCDKILDIASEEHGNIDLYSIFTPSCIASFGLSNQLLKRMRVSLTSSTIYVVGN